MSAEQCTRSLERFTVEAWPTIEPATDYSSNWHHGLICERLEAVSRGELRRLLINVPPRYGKTLTAAVNWPCWDWTHHPRRKWAFTTYAQSLTEDAAAKRRHLLKSDWYRERWPHVELTRDRDDEVGNTLQGVLYATSRDGAFTGRGCDFLVIDDIQNPRLALSKAERTNALNYFKQTLPSRLNSKRRGAMVCIMQRLHEKDIARACLDLGWESIILPGMFRARRTFTVGGRTITKEAGESLWPEREGPAEHADLKRQMGSYAYAAQYDQEPAPAEGGLFKRNHFAYWTPAGEGTIRLQPRDGEPILIDLAACRIFSTVDCAASKNQLADYTVCSTWAVTPCARLILLDRVRGRMEIPEAVKAIKGQADQHRVQYVTVETNAMGIAVAQLLRAAHVPVKGLPTTVDKVTRSATAQVEVEAGRVFLPAMAEWAEEFVEECAGFPGEHDDQVDTLSAAAEDAFRAGAAPESDEARKARHAAEEEARKAEAEQRHQEALANVDDERWWA